MADSTAPDPAALTVIERSTLARAVLDTKLVQKFPHIFGPGTFTATAEELRAAWPEIVAASELLLQHPPVLARREVLPMNSGTKRCAPGDIIEVEGTPKRPAFRPERFFVQDAPDWEIVDILVDGKTQFLQPGPIPGEVFANGLSEFITFDTVQKDKSVRIVAKYRGADLAGRPFMSGMLGTSAIDTSEL